MPLFKSEIDKFIGTHALSAFADAIKALCKELGAKKVSELYDVTKEELEEEGWKLLAQNRFLKAVKAHKLEHPEARGRAASSSRGSGASGRRTSSRSTPPPSPISSSGGAKWAEAIFDFKTTKKSQLGFKKGEKFKILDSGKMWWTAKNTSGKVGSVPSNYMQECEPPIGGDDSDSSGSDYEAFDPKDIHGGLPQGQADDYVNAEMWSTETQRRGSSASSSSSRGRAASTGSRPRSQVGTGGKNKPVPIDEKLYDRDSSDDDSDYEDPDNVKPIVRRGGKLTKTRTDSVKVVPATKALPENPREWNSGEVKRWLQENELDDFVEVFYANGFEGDKLMALSAAQFKAGKFDPDRCDVLGAALEKLKSKGKKVKKKAKCLYDFDAKKPGHMSISEGTMVDIVDDSGPWWRARNPSTGEEGLIPSNYVEVVEGAGAGKKRLEEEDWFEPKIDRRDAESRVSRNAVGSFLVRPSKSHAGSFTLTARGHGGVMNLLIRRIGNMFVLGEFGSEFETVGDLIRHYQESDIKVEGKSGMRLSNTASK